MPVAFPSLPDTSTDPCAGCDVMRQTQLKLKGRLRSPIILSKASLMSIACLHRRLLDVEVNVSDSIDSADLKATESLVRFVHTQPPGLEKSTAASERGCSNPSCLPTVTWQFQQAHRRQAGTDSWCPPNRREASTLFLG